MSFTDYDNPYARRNPFRTNWSEKLKNFFTILLVIAIIGGGIFAVTWMVVDVGYQGDLSCLFIRCIKIKN